MAALTCPDEGGTTATAGAGGAASRDLSKSNSILSSMFWRAYAALARKGCMVGSVHESFSGDQTHIRIAFTAVTTKLH